MPPVHILGPSVLGAAGLSRHNKMCFVPGRGRRGMGTIGPPGNRPKHSDLFWSCEASWLAILGSGMGPKQRRCVDVLVSEGRHPHLEPRSYSKHRGRHGLFSTALGASTADMAPKPRRTGILGLAMAAMAPKRASRPKKRPASKAALDGSGDSGDEPTTTPAKRQRSSRPVASGACCICGVHQTELAPRPAGASALLSFVALFVRGHVCAERVGRGDFGAIAFFAAFLPSAKLPGRLVEPILVQIRLPDHPLE